ncbi:MAG: NAD-dependent epimerase/dehydratase family protein [Gemmatimonas sp.]|jgi:UDP-glucose 4-epimerase|uniref:NAD-dependent epimerase/dehydratase family protein n=1 Tax=Gemmatimonas sp. TaxID=1962908 RepID=UPI00391F0936|nr:NAD-dependent epimerase/dehydratase family protein [Gemmatimonadota bacterium]
MANRVLVTGGAGFIGSHVADRFVAEGWEVTILDDLSSGREENMPSGARFVRGDITTPEAAMLVRDGRFDVLCHLAAQIDVRRSVLDPVYDATRNILGTLNLMEAVKTSGHTTRTIFSSTGGALYGDFDPPPSMETLSKDPEAPYGIAKLSVEYYLAYYGRVHGLDTVALRYGNVYGPRQDPHGEAGVVAIFCNRLLDGRALTVFGNGEQTRDYVYAGDVAGANFAAATCALPPRGRLDARAFNIGTGVETSVNALAETLREVSGGTAPIAYAPARAGELARSALQTQKARDVLGWGPTVSLREGLSRTFRFFADRRGGVTA